jgi:hypothetical protein
VREFERAAQGIPAARLAAAQTLARMGARERAADQLREYLSSADPAGRAVAETWLATLTGR